MSGIFGFIGRGNAFVEVRTGLENLSHRGQESWGIVIGLERRLLLGGQHDGLHLHEPHGQPVALRRRSLSAMSAIPTAGEASERNSQPIIGTAKKEKIAVVHNGHFPRYRQMMERLDGLFQTDTDTEVILQMIARAEGEDMFEKAKKTLSTLGRETAFSLIILHKGRLIAARDPFGFSPFQSGAGERRGTTSGRLPPRRARSGTGSTGSGTSSPARWSSSTGTRRGPSRSRLRARAPASLSASTSLPPPATCSPGTFTNSGRRSGARLAKGETQKADMVVPIPRAAIPGALGFHGATRIPYKEIIYTVGRDRPDIHHLEGKGQARKGRDAVPDQPRDGEGQRDHAHRHYSS